MAPDALAAETVVDFKKKGLRFCLLFRKNKVNSGEVDMCVLAKRMKCLHGRLLSLWHQIAVDCCSLGQIRIETFTNTLLAFVVVRSNTPV